MTQRGFAIAVVAAQVLAQIGAFALAALLPGYIARWDLSSAQAGWMLGIFFAGYVAAVPVLVALTDRIPARRVYLFGTACTALSHLGFVLLADGFWGGLVLRALGGIGWAGCYMPGLKVLADRLTGDAQARAVGWHAAGVGVSGAASFLVAGGLEALAGPEAAFLFCAERGPAPHRPARFPPGAAQPRRHGLDHRLHLPHLGDGRGARMGRDPKTSVLNGFSQMHEVKNVFITDGSFMTSSSCVNPSLTYMAMTARACAYAVEEMKKQNL